MTEFSFWGNKSAHWFQYLNYGKALYASKGNKIDEKQSAFFHD